MTKAEAEKILEEDHHISFQKDGDSICLDGWFDREKLEAAMTMLEEKKDDYIQELITDFWTFPSKFFPSSLFQTPGERLWKFVSLLRIHWDSEKQIKENKERNHELDK